MKAPATNAGMMLARNYGTRSLWNVSQGRFWFFMWTVVGAFVGFCAQELLGPYVLFHE
eukprot:NODE_8459_length_382_cov_232.764526.p3 GENE.NODE_8459_length_382_cov_232.764526~~NODE_8459_length_382_cov_232.764526.p3  ORF type:complete len:58 (+),score=18.36 NODE_8459_length_382_cov_232.764526:78-251(+)